MNFDEFQNNALKNASYPRARLSVNEGRGYCYYSLVACLNDMFSAQSYTDKLKQASNALWYVAALAQESGIKMAWVCKEAPTKKTLQAMMVDPSILPVITMTAIGKIGKALAENLLQDRCDGLGVKREPVQEGLSFVYCALIAFALYTSDKSGIDLKGEPVVEFLMRGALHDDKTF